MNKSYVLIVACLLVGCADYHSDHQDRGCRVVDAWIYNGYGTNDYAVTLSCGSQKYLGNDDGEKFHGYEIGDVWNGAGGPHE